MKTHHDDQAIAGELNLGDLLRAIAARFPDRAAVVQGERTLTYGALLDRSSRLARFLNDHGSGHFAERSRLLGHEPGQHLLAQYLHNCPEYMEGLYGSYLGRVAPFNVNYRYLAEELGNLLLDARPTAIQYHASFAPVLQRVLPHLPGVRVLLQVDDRSGYPLLPGAFDYEEALASVRPEIDLPLSPDDLYVLYTGGTTGMPKGVLWRQADVAVTTLGLYNRVTNGEWNSMEECVESIGPMPNRVLPCAPLIHGAAQWGALRAIGEGNTVVFPERSESFSATEALKAVARHQVSVITFVGDAFAWPLVEELELGIHDVSSLKFAASGGAALHASSKQRLIDLVPGLQVVERIGSSESGVLASRQSHDAASASDPTFVPDPSAVVVAEDFSRVLEPGHDGIGWLARTGRIPLGYLRDAEKTARTFPVVDGRRLSIPGDRARLLPGGDMQLLGRDSLTINTGGEKVFVEEVEGVLKDHPDVTDAVVCGRPSAKWGSEVAALVVAPSSFDEQALLDFCRSRLARYKVPKIIRGVDEIIRTVSGKPDYRWASKQIS
jgi:fatty-acyl-CoA synthase